MEDTTSWETHTVYSVDDIPDELMGHVDRLLIEGATAGEVVYHLDNNGLRIDQRLIDDYISEFLPAYRRAVQAKNKLRGVMATSIKGSEIGSATAMMMMQALFERTMKGKFDSVENTEMANALARLMEALSSRDKILQEIQFKAREKSFEVEKILREARVGVPVIQQVVDRVTAVAVL